MRFLLLASQAVFSGEAGSVRQHSKPLLSHCTTRTLVYLAVFCLLTIDELSCTRQADVDEALRLMLMSKISLRDDDDRHRAKEDPIVAIYGKVREDILRNHKQTYTWEEVTSLCSGYTVSIHHRHL